MLAVAAGLASVGMMPWISTFVAFAVVRPARPDPGPRRAAEAEHEVTRAARRAVCTGRAGKTHQIVDDISIMRAMPRT